MGGLLHGCNHSAQDRAAVHVSKQLEQATEGGKGGATVWRDLCDACPISKDRPEAKRKAFYRARTDLTDVGLIEEHGEWIWISETY